jgi:hypothetical protein
MQIKEIDEPDADTVHWTHPNQREKKIEQTHAEYEQGVERESNQQNEKNIVHAELVTDQA